MNKWSNEITDESGKDANLSEIDPPVYYTGSLIEKNGNLTISEMEKKYEKLQKIFKRLKEDITEHFYSLLPIHNQTEQIKHDLKKSIDEAYNIEAVDEEIRFNKLGDLIAHQIGEKSHLSEDEVQEIKDNFNADKTIEIENEAETNVDETKTDKHQSNEPITNSTNEAYILKMMPQVFHYPEILIFTNQNNVYKIHNQQNHQRSPQVLSEVMYEPDEKPIYMAGTRNYKGFLFVGYQNGKLAKISLEAYQTETLRKKLKGAYNTESPLLFIELAETELDLIFVSNLQKIVMVNTSLINAVGSRNTKGVQVMKSKNQSYVTAIKKPTQVQFADLEYYRKELNVVGFYLKQGDSL